MTDGTPTVKIGSVPCGEPNSESQEVGNERATRFLGGSESFNFWASGSSSEEFEVSPSIATRAAALDSISPRSRYKEAALERH